MSKRASLNHQIHLRMEALKCFGESRIEANKEYRETIDRSYNNKTVGIHSYNSYAAYKQTCKEFSKWLKENYRVKNIEDITTQHIEEYLKYRASKGLAISTIKKDMSALNKVFNIHLNQESFGIS